MSDERAGIEGLGEASRRLDEIASLLGDESTSDSEAVALAQEAARIAADASTAAAEAAREAAERGSEGA